MSDVAGWAKLVSAVVWPFIVLLAMFVFRDDIIDFLGRITKIRALGGELRTNARNVDNARKARAGTGARAATQAALSDRLAYSSWEAFEKIDPWLDQRKAQRAINRWARDNNAQDPSDMGEKNFRRCLYDLGLPGGENFPLEHNSDGSLKYQ